MWFIRSLECDLFFFFFQAEDGIRDLVRSRGLGDVYKRQVPSLRVPCRSGVGGKTGREYRQRMNDDTRLVLDLSLIHI